MLKKDDGKRASSLDNISNKVLSSVFKTKYIFFYYRFRFMDIFRISLYIFFFILLVKILYSLTFNFINSLCVQNVSWAQKAQHQYYAPENKESGTAFRFALE